MTVQKPFQVFLSRRCDDHGQLQSDFRQNRQHALQQLGRLLVFAEVPVGQRQIVEGHRNLNMILPMVLHLDIDGPFKDVLGVVEVLEVNVDCQGSSM